MTASEDAIFGYFLPVINSARGRLSVVVNKVGATMVLRRAGAVMRKWSLTKKIVIGCIVLFFGSALVSAVVNPPKTVAASRGDTAQKVVAPKKIAVHKARVNKIVTAPTTVPVTVPVTAAPTTTSPPAPTPKPKPTPKAPTTAVAVLAWWNNSGQTDANTISSDMSLISTDVSSSTDGDYAAVGGDCASLGSDISAIQSDPPVPDPTLAADWSTALADYGQGASACVSGVNDSDANEVNQATSDFQAGNTAIGQMTTDIGNLLP